VNDEQVRYWQAYIRALADLLDLRDWEVILTREWPDSNSAWASNFTYYGQRRCEIRINPTLFFQESAESQRRIITHELLHCHTDGVWEAIRIYCNGQEGAEASLFERYFKQQGEWMVDSLATAIAKHLPLPEQEAITT
jgi:hypothetical protein